MERSHELLASLSDKHLALFDHEGWLDIVMVQCWHFNLDSFDTIAADEAHLSGLCLISVHIDRSLGQLEAEEPLDLTLHLGRFRVENDVLDVKGAQGVAVSFGTCVYPLHLPEALILLRLLLLHWLVVAGLHLSVRVVAWVGQLIGLGDRVPELNSPIHR